MPPIQHYQLPPEMQPKNLAHFHPLQEELRGHVRNRNYSNADIQQKQTSYLLTWLVGKTQLAVLGGRKHIMYYKRESWTALVNSIRGH